MLRAWDGARAPERPVLCLQEQQRLSERGGRERRGTRRRPRGCSDDRRKGLPVEMRVKSWAGSFWWRTPQQTLRSVIGNDDDNPEIPPLSPGPQGIHTEGKCFTWARISGRSTVYLCRNSKITHPKPKTKQKLKRWAIKMISSQLQILVSYSSPPNEMGQGASHVMR